MNQDALRLHIVQKLADGQLPHDSILRLSGRPSTGETCDACESVIESGQFVMRGTGPGDRSLQFHVDCLYLWEVARQAPGRPTDPEYVAQT